jgi:hypothetical protein
MFKSGQSANDPIADLAAMVQGRRMMRQVFGVFTLFALTLATPVTAENAATFESIGWATMDKSRTLTLHLMNDGDGQPVHAVITYKPDNPHYASVLKHLGGMQPGEHKNVAPWPER